MDAPPFQGGHQYYRRHGWTGFPPRILPRADQARGIAGVRLEELSLPLTPTVRRWMHGPDERRLVRVPKAFLDDRRCENQLNGSTESVDRSDVLGVVVQDEPFWPPDFRHDPVSLHLTVDLCRIFPPEQSPLHTPYINEASSTIFVEPRIPANAFRNLPNDTDTH